MKAQELIDKCDEPYNVKSLRSEIRDAEIRNKIREDSE